MEQKKFMDIQALRPNNSQGFEVGDHVVIQEKIDGIRQSYRIRRIHTYPRLTFCNN